MIKTHFIILMMAHLSVYVFVLKFSHTLIGTCLIYGLREGDVFSGFYVLRVTQESTERNTLEKLGSAF
jgi:hypothetical protein